MAALHNASTQDDIVQVEKAEILAAIELEDGGGGFKWRHLIWDTTGQRLTYRLLLCGLTTFFQQFNGVSDIEVALTRVSLCQTRCSPHD